MTIKNLRSKFTLNTFKFRRVGNFNKIAARSVALMVATLFMSEPALAQSFDVNEAADNILGILQGGLVRIGMIIALIIAGVGLAFGYVNKGQFVAIFGAIIIIFSAPFLVDTVAGVA